METNATSLSTKPEDTGPEAPKETFLTEYEKRQKRQYNRLFVICWLIILVTGLITLFLVSGLRFWHPAKVVSGT